MHLNRQFNDIVTFCCRSNPQRYQNFYPFKKALVLLLAFLPGILTAQPIPEIDAEILVVDVILNGQQQGNSIIAMDENGGLYVRRQALEEWNIQKPFPDSVEINGQIFHPVSQLNNYQSELDFTTYRLTIDLQVDAFQSQIFDVGRRNVIYDASSDIGLFLDYDVSLRHDSVIGDNSGFILEPVFFAPQGHFVSRVAWQNNITVEDQDQFVFLDNFYRRDDPEKQTTLIIGDSIAPSGRWNRALRFSGIQFGRNFSLQPMQITFPLPSLSGEAAIPSTIDLFVNQNQIASRQAEPGLFEIPDIPIVNGAGELQLIVTDQLGRQSVISTDFYASSDMLRKGLNSYSVNIGALRERVGIESFVYGDSFAMVDYQYGLTNLVTLGARVEADSEKTNIGVSGVVNLWQKGVLNASLAMSSEEAASLARINYQYSNFRYRLSFGYQYTQEEFGFIGVATNLFQPVHQFNINAGLLLDAYGSLGVAFSRQEFVSTDDLNIISINYQKSINRLFNLTASLSQIRSGNNNDTSFGISITRSFGTDRSASLDYSGNSTNKTARAQFNKFVPYGEGTGYSLGLANNDINGSELEADLIHRARTYSAQAEARVRNSETGAGLNLSGSVSAIGDHVGFSREVQNAFALVEVPDMADVRVYLENQLIGHTDENGFLVVPSLRPYDLNKLNIAVQDLPIETDIAEVSKVVTPYQRSGSIVSFDISTPRNYQFIVMVSETEIIKEGSAVFTENPDISPQAEQLTLTGYNGLVYLNLNNNEQQAFVRVGADVCVIDLATISAFNPRQPSSTLQRVPCDPIEAE